MVHFLEPIELSITKKCYFWWFHRYTNRKGIKQIGIYKNKRRAAKTGADSIAYKLSGADERLVWKLGQWHNIRFTDETRCACILYRLDGRKRVWRWTVETFVECTFSPGLRRRLSIDVGRNNPEDLDLFIID